MKKTLTFGLIFIFMLKLNGFAQDTIVYKADIEESYVAWHSNIHKGKVPLKEGEVKVVGDKIVGGEFVMLMDSLHDIDIDYDLMRKTLENTLRSEIFFDTKKYPYAYFSLYYVEKKKDHYEVMGNLKLKDIVHCVQFPAKIKITPKELEAVSDTFQINRFNWGITIYSKREAADNGGIIIDENIDLKVYLKACRQAEN